MKAYLFGWNPLKFPWLNMDEDIAKLKANCTLEESWTVASHKIIQPGDRAYVMRVGVEPKGIFASGTISSEPYMAVRNNRPHYRVNIALDVMLNPAQEQILSLDILRTSNLALQNWTPQASGISIKPELVEELEGVWRDLLSEPGFL